MRKLGALIFAVFYTVSVVSLTVQRTDVWATDLAQVLKHLGTTDAGVGDSHKHEHAPHQVNGKLLGDHNVVISTSVRSFEPPYSGTPHHQLLGFAPDQRSRAVSSRAPPTLL